MIVDSLARRASQRRALDLALDCECPDPLHWHARKGVPCTPPDAEHEWGWCCIPRFELAETVRVAHELARRHEEQRQRREQRQERRDEGAARQRARIASAIATAARRPEEV